MNFTRYAKDDGEDALGERHVVFDDLCERVVLAIIAVPVRAKERHPDRGRQDQKRHHRKPEDQGEDGAQRPAQMPPQVLVAMFAEKRAECNDE